MTPRGHYPDLAGRVVLITGGASGIGETHVRAFAASGAKVAFIDKQDEAGKALERELQAGGATVSFVQCDLLDIDALGAAIDRVGETLGPVHGLINNAAVDQRHEIGTIKPDDFDWMMNVNLRHAIFAAQRVLPQMRTLGGGSIVNTSSVAWMRGIANVPLYSAAKAAIIGFTNSLARAAGPDRVRVNAIAPGYVATPRQRALWHDAEAEKRTIALQCLPDAIEPQDIAETALFLCSDAARMITKQCITINGGSL
ncbi:SDR family NAD(P)-dependent oxidoreductase [Bosea caraganae]|uniref:SDR family NAD(P)-dependent oxidoreductase n=1 Tax=Bosea caraganae TaxID=2763117 RepID=A0A370L3C4_9HYPH|nr:SDR family oxidoreductase [Bosea caraganae]RDJ22196.1 SDR family NAD(P)-dependent oxidoreductase [Bosea caraganae]RDJ22717.1 SDR family NAD(P)-dependent oxidoreductase [Bosea caraganae]